MIYYETYGGKNSKTPWLTLVHGFTHNHNYFSTHIPRFQHRFRILALDLRGHGQSSSYLGPFGIEEYSQDISDILQQIGIEKTHYWGTHTGSAIGLRLALLHPDRFASLVLEGTFLPGYSMPRVQELLDRAKMVAKTEGVEEAKKDWLNNADWFDYIRNNPAECRAEDHNKMVFQFKGEPLLCMMQPKDVTYIADELSSINQPVLVYNGEHDMPDFLRAAAKLQSELPNVKCLKIPNAGGFPAWENPQKVQEYVKEFFEDFNE
jgi:pimeloyl-ACP methyl ester carboxylesterase